MDEKRLKELAGLLTEAINERAVEEAISDILLDGENAESLESMLEDPGSARAEDIAFVVLHNYFEEGDGRREVKKGFEKAIRKLDN